MVDDNACDKKRLRTFIRNVRQEILNLQAGESRFRTGAIHFEQTLSGGKPGVVQRLDALDEYPSKENLDLFLAIASQDFGARAGEAFKTWSDGIFPADIDTIHKAQKKPFEVKIKDGFYDLFKAANIPLNPKQVDLITVHSGKLARTFKEEIQNTMRDEIKALVEKAKLDESPKSKLEKKDVVNTGHNSATGYTD